MEKSGDTVGCIFRRERKDFGCRQRNKPGAVPDFNAQIIQLPIIAEPVGLPEG